MQYTLHEFSGVTEFQPRVFHDERGFFFESYSSRSMEASGLTENFVQDNQSFSQKGVLRGLHFQKPPYAQGKLVRVISGRVIDVIVDIRPDSSTFGRWASFELSAEKNNMLYVPVGFAHGFAALEDTIFFYKCTGLYDKPSEGGIRWNDPTLNVDWGIKNPNVSPKDEELPYFNDCKEDLMKITW